jgi:hypothetical protein
VLPNYILLVGITQCPVAIYMTKLPVMDCHSTSNMGPPINKQYGLVGHTLTRKTAILIALMRQYRPSRHKTRLAAAAAAAGTIRAFRLNSTYARCALPFRAHMLLQGPVCTTHSHPWALSNDASEPTSGSPIQEASRPTHIPPNCVHVRTGVPKECQKPPRRRLPAIQMCLV